MRTAAGLADRREFDALHLSGFKDGLVLRNHELLHNLPASQKRNHMGFNGLLGLRIDIANGTVHVVFDDNRWLTPIYIEVVHNSLVDPSLADIAIVRLLLLLFERKDLA